MRYLDTGSRDRSQTLGAWFDSVVGDDVEITDLSQLLAAAGPPRSSRRIGVMSFGRGLFHPKVFHLTRGDGSAAA